MSMYEKKFTDLYLKAAGLDPLSLKPRYTNAPPNAAGPFPFGMGPMPPGQIPTNGMGFGSNRSKQPFRKPEESHTKLPPINQSPNMSYNSQNPPPNYDNKKPSAPMEVDIMSYSDV